MVKFIVLAVVGYVFYRALKSWMLGGREQPDSVDTQNPKAVDDVLVQDPVCKTYIAQRSSITLQQGDETLHFCSEQCRDRYVQEQAEG
jgi:YHS domain-containing protein